VDRARPGSKHHVLTEGGGIPLSVSLTGGNRNDVTELEALIDAIPPVRGRRGRPRQRPDELYGDRAYDHDKYRRKVRAKGIRPRIARRGPPARVRAGQAQVGGRAHDCLVSRHETTTHPLGTLRRHPRSLPRSGHLHHHLATHHTTVLGTVRPCLIWLC
jgi:hypothetical protein